MRTKDAIEHVRQLVTSKHVMLDQDDRLALHRVLSALEHAAPLQETVQLLGATPTPPHRTHSDIGGEDFDDEMMSVCNGIATAIDKLPLPSGYCCAFVVLRSEDRSRLGGKMDASFSAGCVPDPVGGPATIGSILKQYGSVIVDTAEEAREVDEGARRH